MARERAAKRRMIRLRLAPGRRRNGRSTLANAVAERGQVLGRKHKDRDDPQAAREGKGRRMNEEGRKDLVISEGKDGVVI